jgi:hypothetical protein
LLFLSFMLSIISGEMRLTKRFLGFLLGSRDGLPSRDGRRGDALCG